MASKAYTDLQVRIRLSRTFYPTLKACIAHRSSESEALVCCLARPAKPLPPATAARLSRRCSRRSTSCPLTTSSGRWHVTAWCWTTWPSSGPGAGCSPQSRCWPTRRLSTGHQRVLPCTSSTCTSLGTRLRGTRWGRCGCGRVVALHRCFLRISLQLCVFPKHNLLVDSCMLNAGHCAARLQGVVHGGLLAAVMDETFGWVRPDNLWQLYCCRTPPPCAALPYLLTPPAPHWCTAGTCSMPGRRPAW